jgi:hypothetical protein
MARFCFAYVAGYSCNSAAGEDVLFDCEIAYAAGYFADSTDASCKGGDIFDVKEL